MKNLSTKWQKLIAYLTGFLGIIPFLLAGGYIHLKSEDEAAKKSVKTAFLLTVLFTVIEAIVAIVCAFTEASVYIDFDYTAHTGSLIFAAIVTLIKFVAFTTVFCLDAFTMIKFDCIIALFGGMDKGGKTVNAQKRASGPAYLTKVRIEKQEVSEPATEETVEETTEETATDAE